MPLSGRRHAALHPDRQLLDEHGRATRRSHERTGRSSRPVTTGSCATSPTYYAPSPCWRSTAPQHRTFEWCSFNGKEKDPLSRDNDVLRLGELHLCSPGESQWIGSALDG